jgi:hypothetical protein
LVSRSHRGQPRDGLQQDNINISGSVIALGYPGRHWLYHQNKAACSVPLAIDQIMLLSCLHDLLQRAANFSIGKAWHWGLP